MSVYEPLRYPSCVHHHILESKNLLLRATFTHQVSANGNVLRSEIVGSIKMRVFLSGMPELRLGLNDKVLFENTGREFP